MKIIIGCNHAGAEPRHTLLASVLQEHTIVDMGTDSSSPADHPDSRRVATATDDNAFGTPIWRGGTGMAMATGKVKGIRAARCGEPYSAGLSRRYNDANVLCLGARVIGSGTAEQIAARWLSTPFDGGRHTRRLGRIE